MLIFLLFIGFTSSTLSKFCSCIVVDLIKYPGQGLHDQINIHDRSGLEVLGDGMDLLLHKLCEKKQGKLFIR